MGAMVPSLLPGRRDKVEVFRSRMRMLGRPGEPLTGVVGIIVVARSSAEANPANDLVTPAQRPWLVDPFRGTPGRLKGRVAELGLRDRLLAVR